MTYSKKRTTSFLLQKRMRMICMKRVVVLLEKNVSFVHIQKRKRRSLIASDKAIICIFDEGGITRVVQQLKSFEVINLSDRDVEV